MKSEMVSFWKEWLSMDNIMIEVKDMSFGYGKDAILSNVNFIVKWCRKEYVNAAVAWSVDTERGRSKCAYESHRVCAAGWISGSQ